MTYREALLQLAATATPADAARVHLVLADGHDGEPAQPVEVREAALRELAEQHPYSVVEDALIGVDMGFSLDVILATKVGAGPF